MYQTQTLAPLSTAFIPPCVPIVPACIPLEPVDGVDTIINIGSGSIGGNPSPVTVTEVTTPTYTALASDYFLCVTHAGQVVITLPVGILGTVYVIKDWDGNASILAPIIVQGTGQNVDSGTATINTSFGSITVIFNGSVWSIV